MKVYMFYHFIYKVMFGFKVDLKKKRFDLFTILIDSKMFFEQLRREKFSRMMLGFDPTNFAESFKYYRLLS